MEILTVSEINSPSLFLVPNSPSKQKSPQPKLNSKNRLAKNLSNLQYVPKKPSSPGVETKCSSSDIPTTATPTKFPNGVNTSPSKTGKTKKPSKKKAVKKASTQAPVQKSVQNNSPKKMTRAPLSTIYDSTSNTPKRAEYRPVLKKNIFPTLEKSEELKKSLTTPTITPKSDPTSEKIPISATEPEPFPVQPEPLPVQPEPLPVQLEKKQRKIYSKNQLLAIGGLPICLVPHSGKTPTEIIEEYNLQYAQQEKEITKLQEEEKLFYNQNFCSSYPNLSHSYDSSYSELSQSVNIFYSPNHNILRSSYDSPNTFNTNAHSMFQSPFSKNNKKAWIPRKSTDSLDTSTDTLNSPSRIDATQPSTISQNKVLSLQNSFRSSQYNYINNNEFLLKPSLQQRSQEIHSTDYQEPDQNEYSDNENEGFEENSLRYSFPQEVSPKRLESRQKQIDIGKNTPGYKNYLQLTKKEKRKYYDPHTPDKYQICSKRSWDGQIRVWRKLLHLYDPKKTDNDDTEIIKE